MAGRAPLAAARPTALPFTAPRPCRAAPWRSRARALRGLGCRLGLCALASLAWACQRAAPASQFPTPRLAIERMRADLACSRGLVGEGKLDYFGDEGRIRARTLYVVARPARLRFDLLNPLGGVLSTLTSDGQRFAYLDQRQRSFLQGPADECNVEQALRVPVPPEALGQLLTGQAPILRHQPEQARLRWDDGSYVIEIASEHDASEVVRLVPRDEDWDRPWQKQRLRVTEVSVSQKGLVLYRAQLSDHRAAPTAPARVDPDGIEPDIPPSGPACHAELPRRVRFLVPGAGRDILLEQSDVQHNPPLTPGMFQLEPPAGVRVLRSSCPR